MIVISFSVFAPIIVLPGLPANSCDRHGCVPNRIYQSLTFAYLGWGGSYQAGTGLYEVGTHEVVPGVYNQNYIEVRDLTICAKNCTYPSPYLLAEVFVNGSVPLVSLHLFVNGTDQGGRGYDSICCLRNFSIQFKTQVNNQTIPIIAGNPYSVKFVATFQDNSTSTSVYPVNAE